MFFLRTVIQKKEHGRWDSFYTWLVGTEVRIEEGQASWPISATRAVLLSRYMTGSFDPKWGTFDNFYFLQYYYIRQWQIQLFLYYIFFSLTYFFLCFDFVINNLVIILFCGLKDLVSEKPYWLNIRIIRYNILPAHLGKSLW